jgi:hypothetical protein
VWNYLLDLRLLIKQFYSLSFHIADQWVKDWTNCVYTFPLHLGITASFTFVPRTSQSEEMRCHINQILAVQSFISAMRIMTALSGYSQPVVYHSAFSKCSQYLVFYSYKTDRLHKC